MIIVLLLFNSCAALKALETIKMIMVSMTVATSLGSKSVFLH